MVPSSGQKCKFTQSILQQRCSLYSDVRQQWWKNKDGPANKVHLTSAEDIQDETLVSVRKLHVLKTPQVFNRWKNVDKKERTNICDIIVPVLYFFFPQYLFSFFLCN